MRSALPWWFYSFIRRETAGFEPYTALPSWGKQILRARPVGPSELRAARTAIVRIMRRNCQRASTHSPFGATKPAGPKGRRREKNTPYGVFSEKNSPYGAKILSSSMKKIPPMADFGLDFQEFKVLFHEKQP